MAGGTGFTSKTRQCTCKTRHKGGSRRFLQSGLSLALKLKQGVRMIGRSAARPDPSIAAEKRAEQETTCCGVAARWNRAPKDAQRESCGPFQETRNAQRPSGHAMVQRSVDGPLADFQENLEQSFDSGCDEAQASRGGNQKPASSRIADAPPKPEVRKCAGRRVRFSDHTGIAVAPISTPV